MKNRENNVNITYAQKDDFLWIREHDTHISEKIIQIKIENKEIYIVKYSEKRIGLLRYNLFWDNIPFMNMIYILEESRKMGIGKKLIEYWEKEMRQYGYNNVLTSTQFNEEAQHFYRKIGYKEIGGFKYLNDPYEIIFQKILE